MGARAFLLTLQLGLAGLLCADAIIYTYDDAGRLIGATYPNGSSISYTYDLAGNLTVRKVTGGTAPLITNAGVVNAASFVAGSIAPGEIATIFGSNLTTANGVNLTSTLPLPGQFLNVSVMVNGTAAPLFAVDNVGGQQQINFQVPWEVAGNPSASVQVVNNGAPSATLTVPVAPTQPGIINYVSGGNTFGVILHADYSLANSGSPAAAGETVLIYCTGLGAVTPQPATGASGASSATAATAMVTIGGTPAQVDYSGLAPGFVGLNQLNVEIPTGLATGNQPVVINIGGASSNMVLLPVQ